MNQIIESNQRLVNEFERIGTVVGKEGRTSQRIELGRAGGGWADCIRSVNTLISDLVQPTAEMGRVIGAVARGDTPHPCPRHFRAGGA